MNIDDYFATLERGLCQNSLVSHLQEPFACAVGEPKRPGSHRLPGLSLVWG